MKRKISASEQVRHRLRCLPPDAKQGIRIALRLLAENGHGDIKALEGELQGFYRLRVGGYRIIYSEQAGQLIRLEYADRREFVYEQFVRILKEAIG